MNKITSKISKNYYITLPCTPAEFTTKKPEIISDNGAIIEISCGGGMGGSYWKEYIIDFDVDALNVDGIIKVTLFNGETKYINTRNIVTATPVTIIRVSVNSKNTNFTHNYQEMYFTVNDVKHVKLINSYKCPSAPNTENLKPFKTINGVI